MPKEKQPAEHAFRFRVTIEDFDRSELTSRTGYTLKAALELARLAHCAQPDEEQRPLLSETK